MRVLTAVWAALLTVAWGSPAALAQSDGRETYGPVAATRGKPKAEAKPQIAKPQPAKPETARPETAKPAAAEAAQKPKAAPKPAADKKTADKKEAVPPTDGRADREKSAGKKDNKKDAKSAREKPGTTGNANAAAGAPKPPGIRETYMALPHAERLALQFNLTWAGDYRGAADGEFSDKLAEAMKDYQKRNKFKVTGLLTPEERTALAAAVAPRQREAGWQMTEDPATGSRVGIPSKYATKMATGPAGSRWSSEQGQLQIETFRVDTGATLEAVFEQQKSLPRRRITASNLGSEAFTLAGMQGLKRMRVYGYARDGEVRGLTILYDQAMDGTMDPLVAPIAWAYLPFPQGFSLAAATEAPRRKVEYGTGVFVSAAGHVLTDRRLVDGCQVITLPLLGHAERVAEDRVTGLALLRINGVSGIKPAALAADGAAAGDGMLIGVPDPKAQAGGSDVSSVKARVVAAASARTLDPPPPFSPAAFFSSGAKLAGIVPLRDIVSSSTVSTMPQAVLVPVEPIRTFLQKHDVPLELAAGNPDPAKESVTRVICVRK
jgi:peptidoglycan hydrolase-like protein with peptidoglycan-binding domain